MKEWETAIGVFMNERESWRVHLALYAEAARDAFDEFRFAGPQFAGEANHQSGGGRFAPALAQDLRLFRTAGNECSHELSAV